MNTSNPLIHCVKAGSQTERGQAFPVQESRFVSGRGMLPGCLKLTEAHDLHFLFNLSITILYGLSQWFRFRSKKSPMSLLLLEYAILCINRVNILQTVLKYILKKRNEKVILYI